MYSHSRHPFIPLPIFLYPIFLTPSSTHLFLFVSLPNSSYSSFTYTPMAHSYEKSTHSSVDDHEKHREFDREIREMVSTLTSRLGLIRKGGSGQHHEVADDQGSSVITLAGTNTGATMRAELNGKTTKLEEAATDENESLTSYINSNFQAINNSIMFGGSYTGNDPGVHMDMSDYYEGGQKAEKGAAKGKKVGKDNDESVGSRLSKE